MFSIRMTNLDCLRIGVKIGFYKFEIVVVSFGRKEINYHMQMVDYFINCDQMNDNDFKTG